MYSKKGKWTSRRRRKASFGWNSKKIVLLLLIIAAIVTWQVFSANLLQTVIAQSPVDRDVSGGDEVRVEISSGGRLLLRMVSDNIPGMPSSALASQEEIQAAIMDTFKSVTGVDPRDPRSFLMRELGVGALLPMPVLETPGEDTAPPPGRDNGNTDEDPGSHRGEEEIPVFSPNFPFLGYSEPVALIHHTHATEAFVPTSGVTYTRDLDYTVVRLGDELVSLLTGEYGLPLIHERGVYDIPRVQAYEKTRPVVQRILKENPQLEMVLDLHRDGVRRETTTATINGETLGRILIVIGTRNSGWEKNYAFALRLHQELEVVAPGISKGILQKHFSYNQDLHPKSLIIEIGGHENTLEEAMLSIPYLAEALARTYYAFFVQN